jgi:hypothetical protein
MPFYRMADITTVEIANRDRNCRMLWQQSQIRHHALKTGDTHAPRKFFPSKLPGSLRRHGRIIDRAIGAGTDSNRGEQQTKGAAPHRVFTY